MKKALSIFANVLAWIVLIFALLITIMVFSSSKNNGVAHLFGFMPMAVESDSMKPTFKQGDLIICKEIDDFNSINDEDIISQGAVIGRWTEVKLPFVGKVMDFLRTKTGFFICIVIPMAIFFLFELYKFIATIIEAKRPEPVEVDEEEIKRRAIEEYLAAQKQAGAAPEKVEAAAEKAEAKVEAAAESAASEAKKLEGAAEALVQTAEESISEVKEAAADAADTAATVTE